VKTLLRELDRFPTRTPAGMQVYRIMSGELPPERVAEGLTIDDLPLAPLHAGLAVLARDMHQYLEAHADRAVELFADAVARVHAEDRARYGEMAFPVYDGLPTAELPSGLAEAAAQGQLTLKPLADPAIVHEWTTFPGFKLFTKLVDASRPHLDPLVCKDGGLLQQYREKKLSAADVQMAIAQALLTTAFTTDLLWVPLVAFVTVLLVRRSLEWYCGVPALPAA
jgi:hypothetical protein